MHDPCQSANTKSAKSIEKVTAPTPQAPRQHNKHTPIFSITLLLFP